MEIWLKHPSHGVKCAYLESEALNDEKNGWSRFDFNKEEVVMLPEPVEKPVLDDGGSEGSESASKPVEIAPKKRGRKPKNRG